jgi:hypothetical protein
MHEKISFTLQLQAWGRMSWSAGRRCKADSLHKKSAQIEITRIITVHHAIQGPQGFYRQA